MERKMRIKDKSSISPAECITEHLLYSFIIFLNYKTFAFIPLNGYTVSKSRLLLISFMVSASVVGSIIRWRKCMKTRAAIADVLVGAGIYTILVYENYYSKWIHILAIVFIVFLICYSFLTLMKKNRGKSIFQIRDRIRKKLIIKVRITNILNQAGLVLGILSLLLILPISYNRIFNGGIVMADAKYSLGSGFDTNYTENEYSLTFNIDNIAKIRNEEVWSKLNVTQRLQVLQDICCCEENYFGLEHQVRVVMDDLDEYTLASYNDSEKLVIIDKQHLENDNPKDVCETLLHEMFHAYEHDLVRLYLDSNEAQRKLRVFQHCDEYIKEMVNYQDGGDDYESFMRYYCQYMEADSRAYASEAVEEYYAEIDEILEEQKNADAQEGVGNE